MSKVIPSLIACALLATLPLVASEGRADAPAATPPVASTPAAGAAAAPSNPAGPATLPKVDELVARVQGFYDKTTSFRSDFSQEFWVKAYNQKKNSRGTVTFQKPGKMDWIYADPRDNRVVSDGATLKVYEAANKQMFEQPVDKSQYPAALSFLTGQGKLSDSFKFEAYAGENMNFAGGYVLVGSPKTETPAYQKVLFYVDAATSQVRRVMIIDGQGNRNRFDFANPKVNLPVESAQFRFSPPAGTSVVRP